MSKCHQSHSKMRLKIRLTHKTQSSNLWGKEESLLCLKQMREKRRTQTRAESTTTAILTAYGHFQFPEPLLSISHSLLKQPQATLNSQQLALPSHRLSSGQQQVHIPEQRGVLSHTSPWRALGHFYPPWEYAEKALCSTETLTSAEKGRDSFIVSMEPDSEKGQPEGDPTSQRSSPGNPGDVINRRGRRLESRNSGTWTERSSYHSLLHCPQAFSRCCQEVLPIIHSEVQSL